MDQENKPTAEDWMKVGNDMRIILNDLNKTLGISPIPLLESPTREPTEKELDAWEKVFPGSKQMLIAQASEEMRHRLSLCRK